MIRQTLAKKLALASTLAAAALLSIAFLPSAGAESLAGATYSCSVDISYVSTSGITETYRRDFVVSVGETFDDDFSTPTRQHVFSATATQQGSGVVIGIDYFSDVSVFDAVDLATALAMKGNQAKEDLAGRHRFFSSLSGNYTITYSLSCRKL